jgi:hypothetical protein
MLQLVPPTTSVETSDGYTPRADDSFSAVILVSRHSLRVFVYFVFLLSYFPRPNSSRRFRMASEKAPLPFGYTFMAGERISAEPGNDRRTMDS